MTEKKIIIGIALVSAVILFGGAFLASNSSSGAEVSVSEEARAVVSEDFHDWGQIGLSEGDVEYEFAIKNEGTGELTLQNISTSCMCTTAVLSLGDEVSPAFGMHSKSNYVMSVPAGEEAKIKIVFDPAFHGPGGVGAITRQVIVETNDPENRTLSFNLTATVVN